MDRGPVLNCLYRLFIEIISDFARLEGLVIYRYVLLTRIQTVGPGLVGWLVRARERVGVLPVETQYRAQCHNMRESTGDPAQRHNMRESTMPSSLKTI